MIPESLKSFTKIMLPPQLKDNGDFDNNTYIDTVQNGTMWGHLCVKFLVGTTDAAIGSTAETAAPKLEECDTTNGTYTAITGAALADAIAGTEGDSIFAIDLNLEGHKRYIQVNVPHAGDGTTGANLTIIGELTKPQIAPITAAQRGLAESVVV